MPGFDNTKSRSPTAKIASEHAGTCCDKLRFSRGASRSNVGLVRFEREGADLVACHDLYATRRGRRGRAGRRPPRQPARFGERAPPLRFDHGVD